METKDYEAEYANRRRVPEHPAIMAGWTRDAEAYRQTAKAELDIVYGDGPRMLMDIFHVAGSTAPIAMFIHGGYWQSFDRRDFSHLAAGLNAGGVAVAIPSYDLCPQVSVRAIVGELRTAVRFLYARTGHRVVAVGHSAGGHLTAALLATDWGAIDPALPADLVPAGMAISGLFDLAPLVGTSINNALQLDAAEARAMSPLDWPVPAGRTLAAWVGADESAEYLRQSRTAAETWAGQGAVTGFHAVPGANHFTVIAPLAERGSAMVATVAEMAHRP